jgi:uncharacterized protein (TIGR03437 family)
MRLLNFVGVTILVLASAAWGNPASWQPAKANVPGEGNCTECHNTYPLNSGSGKVELTVVDGPNTYTPGVPKRLRVTVTDPDARRWGFQATPRLASDATTAAGIIRAADANTEVICSDTNLPDDNGNCPSTGPTQYIGHVNRSTRAGTVGPVTFEFNWTPPSSDVGEVIFYYTGNGANNNNQNTNDRIYAATTRFAFAGGTSGPKPTFTTAAVVNAASFSPERPFAQGSFFSIFGTQLAGSTVVWDSAFVNGVAPTTLAGVRVLINDRPAFLSLVAPGQINAIAPTDTPPGGTSIVVEHNGVRSDTISVTAGDVSPALFTFSPRDNKFLAGTSGDGAAFLGPADLFGGPVNGRPLRPARSGEVIIIYGTGFGPTNPPTEIGRIPSGAAPTANPVTFTIGGRAVTPQYAGRSGFVGVYQFNLQVPTLTNGEHEVRATVNGVTTATGKVLLVGN